MNKSSSTNAQFVHKLDCSDQKSLRFANFRDNFARSRRCSPTSKPVFGPLSPRRSAERNHFRPAFRSGCPAASRLYDAPQWWFDL